MDQKITTLNIICSILQIMGLFLVIFHGSLPSFTLVLIGISGFASVVKFFLPDGSGFEKIALRPLAAFAGVGTIVLSLL